MSQWPQRMTVSCWSEQWATWRICIDIWNYSSWVPQISSMCLWQFKDQVINSNLCFLLFPTQNTTFPLHVGDSLWLYTHTAIAELGTNSVTATLIHSCPKVNSDSGKLACLWPRVHLSRGKKHRMSVLSLITLLWNQWGTSFSYTETCQSYIKNS